MAGLDMLNVSDGCDGGIRVAGGYWALCGRFWTIPLSCPWRRAYLQVGRSVEVEAFVVTVKSGV